MIRYIYLSKNNNLLTKINTTHPKPNGWHGANQIKTKQWLQIQLILQSKISSCVIQVFQSLFLILMFQNFTDVSKKCWKPKWFLEWAYMNTKIMLVLTDLAIKLIKVKLPSNAKTYKSHASHRLCVYQLCFKRFREAVALRYWLFLSVYSLTWVFILIPVPFTVYIFIHSSIC